jgi:hypothetical protein
MTNVSRSEILARFELDADCVFKQKLQKAWLGTLAHTPVVTATLWTKVRGLIELKFEANLCKQWSEILAKKKKIRKNGAYSGLASRHFIGVSFSSRLAGMREHCWLPP